MNLRLRTATAGNVHISHALICALVGLAGLVSLSNLGVSLEHGIGGDGGGARTGFVVSRQAGAESGFVHVAETGARTIREIATIKPRPLEHSELLMGGAQYSLDDVRLMRAAAHDLWAQGRPPTTRTRISVQGRAVNVGAVRRLRTGDAIRAVPKPEGFAAARAEAAQRQSLSLLLRLDEALDLAFARGHVGTYDARHVSLLGEHASLAASHRKSFRPEGVWSVIAHGSAVGFSTVTSFAGGDMVQEALSLDDFARVLYARGYEDGQPILLAACSTGACTNVPHNAALQLAERFNAPVVAPSTKNWVGESNGAMVPVSGDLTKAQILPGVVGEWRLFQPRSWITDYAAHGRVVLGRAAVGEEKIIAGVHELWRLPQGGATRVDFTGDASKFTGENSGAFAAAATALRKGGRIIVRTHGTESLPKITSVLRTTGFEILRARPEDILTIVAKKTW